MVGGVWLGSNLSIGHSGSIFGEDVGVVSRGLRLGMG